MVAMAQDASAWIIGGVFALIALAVLSAAVVALYWRVSARLAGRAHTAAADDSRRHHLSDLTAKMHHRHHGGADGEEEPPAAVLSLLSMLPTASALVDDHDTVLRASPSAYTLGIVDDEAIVNERVRDAIRQVRQMGGRSSFDLTTSTPEFYAGMTASGAEAEDDDSLQISDDTQSVERPNWLKITVGRIDARFVVVLIDDVSDAIRFARTRDDFIANVSEQLVQPMDALEQLAGSMEQHSTDAARVAQESSQVRQACLRLNHMVEDLLLLMKVQAPVIASSANRVNVRHQLDRAAGQLRSLADRLGVGLRVEGDASLTTNGEGAQICAAINRLIDNALVYSSAGGTVNATVSVSQDGKFAVVRVIDQGVGISRADQRHVFERFYRGANQTKASAGGIGLGLAIVKHVALAHHGNATVWSMPGQGSTFSLILPLAQ